MLFASTPSKGYLATEFDKRAFCKAVSGMVIDGTVNFIRGGGYGIASTPQPYSPARWINVGLPDDGWPPLDSPQH